MKLRTFFIDKFDQIPRRSASRLLGMTPRFLCCLLVSCFLSFVSCDAVALNPFFGDKQNQVAFHFGAVGLNSGLLIPPPIQFVPFNFVHFQYSIPSTFFRLPARQSLNVVQTFGWGVARGWSWYKYSIPIAVLTQDVALWHNDIHYFAVGAGMGFQAQENERIGSKLVFSFRITYGFRIAENTRLEIFAQHFSNGNTAPENNSYAFYGIGVTRSF